MDQRGTRSGGSVQPTTSPIGPLKGPASRWTWAFASLLGVLILTSWAVWAAKHPPVERSSSPGSLGFWLDVAPAPPAIGCDINVVYAGPRAHEAWVVGNWGLVLHTTSGGQQWDRLPLAEPAGIKFRPREPTPGRSGWLERVALFPSALAAAPPPSPQPSVLDNAQFPPAPSSVGKGTGVAPPSKKGPAGGRPHPSAAGQGKPAPLADSSNSAPINPLETVDAADASAQPVASSSTAAPQGPRDEDLPHLEALSVDWPGNISAIGRAADGTNWTFPLTTGAGGQGPLKVVVGRMHGSVGDGLADGRGCHLLGQPSRDGSLYVVRPAEVVNQSVRLMSDASPDLKAVGSAVHRSLPVGSYNGVWFADDRHAFVVGDGGAMLETRDGGATWKALVSGTKVDLYGVSFSADLADGWVVGSRGTILHSADGGGSWQRRSRDGAIDAPGADFSFPPFYFIGMLGCVALVLPSLRKPPPEVRQAIAQALGSDRAAMDTSADALDFTGKVNGLSRFLRNANTEPPLTIAVSGEWGSGKSSLMRMLETELRSQHFRPVWFDAWHHQKEDYLLAALLQSVRQNAVPGWLDIRGWSVRARLLAIRARRFVVPLAILWIALFLATGFEFWHHDDGNVWDGLVTTFKAFLPRGQLSDADGGAMALFGALFSNAFALWKGATPFKAKPGQLLSAVAGSGRVRDLEAKMSFRQAFATEFRDVTAALAPQKLPIFIDDLDRCRPEKVIEMLEAISFLAASGECFVIVGMARKPVELAVSLEFGKLAEAAKAEEPPGERETAIQFADRYLEKIISIEIAIGKPDQERSLRLLEKNLRSAPGTSAAGRALRGAVAPLVVAVATLLAIGSFLVGAKLAGHPMQPSPAGAIATAAAPSATASPTGTAAPSWTADSVTRLVTEPVSDATRQYPKVVAAGASDGALVVIALIGLFVGLVVLGIVYARKVDRDTIVYDSLDFERALEAWHPLVHRMFQTPRALKQYWNRVRYIAMMQPDGDQSRIPDGDLAGLAALEAFDPKLLAAGTLLASIPRLAEVDRSLGSLATDLATSAQFDTYRQRFLELSRDLGRPSIAEGAPS